MSVSWLPMEMAVIHKRCTHYAVGRRGRTQDGTSMVVLHGKNLFLGLYSLLNNFTQSRAQRHRQFHPSNSDWLRQRGFPNFFTLSRSIINSSGPFIVLHLAGRIAFWPSERWRGRRQSCESHGDAIRAIQLVASGKIIVTAVSSQNTVLHTSL